MSSTIRGEGEGVNYNSYEYYNSFRADKDKLWEHQLDNVTHINYSHVKIEICPCVSGLMVLW